MDKSFEAQSITLVPNGRGGWQISSNEVMDCHDYSEQELEEAIQQLSLMGWELAAMVDSKYSVGTTPRRNLFFRRKVSAEEQ